MPRYTWSTPFALTIALLPRVEAAASGCHDALAQHAVCEPANALAVDEMKSRGVEAAVVVQDVASGALVVFAASQPSKLDVSTAVLPLSLSKVFLAACWWDHGQPDQLRDAASGKPVDVHEMLVTGSDSDGREVAAALRDAVARHTVVADLQKFAFSPLDGSFWAEIDPQWKKRLTPEAASTDIDVLDPKEWSSALSIGESHMTTTPLQVSRFFQAIGNEGVLCAPIALRAGKGSGHLGKDACMAPTRMVQSATARKFISAALDTVQRGSARRISGALQGTGWAIGGKTGTGGRSGAPLNEQDGWFAGLIFDPQRKPRYTVATFVARGGLGSGNAADISVRLARFLAANETP